MKKELKHDNSKDFRISIAQDINETLTGTLDFKDFAAKSTKIIAANLNLAAVAIFRIDHSINELHSYAYTVSIDTSIIDRILGIPFVKIKTSLKEESKNYTEETAKTGEIKTSHNLIDFIDGVIPKSIGKALQKALKTKTYISIPIKTHNRTEGVLFCATKEFSLDKERELLKIIANQLGLAMSNVMAHERIIEQYKKSLEEKGKPKKLRPRIKFTLRITEELEQYLNFKTVNTKKSKAEYVRSLLENNMKKDEDFKKFNNE